MFFLGFLSFFAELLSLINFLVPDMPQVLSINEDTYMDLEKRDYGGMNLLILIL